MEKVITVFILLILFTFLSAHDGRYKYLKDLSNTTLTLLAKYLDMYSDTCALNPEEKNKLYHLGILNRFIL